MQRILLPHSMSRHLKFMITEQTALDDSGESWDSDKLELQLFTKSQKT